jgi:hypothetical protein
MRETKFIDQNRDKWSKFEKTLKDNEKDPEELKQVIREEVAIDHAALFPSGL